MAVIRGPAQHNAPEEAVHALLGRTPVGDRLTLARGELPDVEVWKVTGHRTEDTDVSQVELSRQPNGCWTSTAHAEHPNLQGPTVLVLTSSGWYLATADQNEDETELIELVMAHT